MHKTKLRAAVPVFFLLTGALLFLTNSAIHPEPSVLFFLGALTLGASLGLLRASSDMRMRPYLGRRSLPCLLLSGYASFASFGYRLFLSGERISVTAKGVAYLLLGAVWFFPVTISMLYLLETACSALETRPDPPASCPTWRVQLLSGLMCFACLLVGLCAFYPGAYPLDAVQQFAQARGNFILRDAHPVMHTMVIRLLLAVYDSEAFVVLVQMACFAALVGRASGIPHRCGISARIILPAVAVFSLLPNQILFHISPLKDVLFTSAMLWGTLLCFDLAMDERRLCRPIYAAQLVFCLLMTGTLRHNGVAPLALMLAALIAVAIRHGGSVRRYAVGVICASLALLCLWRGPALNLLGAAPNHTTPYLTMFCAAGSVINKGGTLGEQNMQKLEAVMPIEDWAAYYSRFSGHDGYMFFRPGGMDLTGFSLRDALGVYLYALMRYPDIVVKDRLDGANLLWDVTQPSESFNAKGFDYMHISEAAGFTMPGYAEGEYYMNASRLAGLYRKMINFAMPAEEERGQLTNMILWRAGAWQIVLLTLMLFWSRRGLGRMYIAAAPLLGNNLLWLFGLYYQAFRYVYYVQALTLVLALCTFRLARAHPQPPPHG